MSKKTPYSLKDWSEVDFAPMPENADVPEAYANGFVGACFNGESEEQLADAVRADGMPWDFADVASSFGIAGAAKPGVYLLYKEVEACGLPLDTIGRVSQPVGNCVSRGTQNALLHTLCAAVNNGEGSLPEGMVEAAQKCNPLSSEVIYWWRGNAPNGDGWYASAALKAAKDHAGLFVRRDLSSIGGVDLRTETRRTAHAYSSRSIPDSVREAISHNRLLTFSKCSSFEEVADAIASGHAVQTDGGEAWSKTVDEFGVARRSGHWSHSMCCTGVITTEEFKKRYNTAGGLIIQNSWAAWNRNKDAKIMGTNVGLPAGAFVALWEDCSRRSFYATNTFHGWENRNLPNWSLEELI